MSTESITHTDVRLRNSIIRQLDWDPEVDAGAIGVAAKDGVVTLTGFVDTYAEKLTAERVAKRVRGVRAVANDITVRLRVERTDADIASDAAQALKLIPALADNVQAAVHNGHVTLTGRMEWLYQRQQAETAVRHIRGIRGIFNHITVTPRAGQRDVQRRIVRALHRNADIDAHHISVTVKDDEVILNGTVSSWMQRDAVERAAGSAPGITRIDNQIVVVPVEPHEFEPPDEIC
jgi:osmotically-inducible protein OsmY